MAMILFGVGGISDLAQLMAAEQVRSRRACAVEAQHRAPLHAEGHDPAIRRRPRVTELNAG